MDKVNQWEKELELLSEILNKTELVQTTKWGVPVFTLKGKNIVGFVGFKNHFSLWFYNGVFLKDPYKVLVSAQEGKTKALRQWRFTSKEEIDEKIILEYVQEAIRNSKDGKELKPEKFQSFPVPEFLKNEFKKDEELKSAFDKLTPGKQKEYSQFIDEAKQEKTKISRIEKIKPLILNGLGLHDKHKKSDEK